MIIINFHQVVQSGARVVSFRYSMTNIYNIYIQESSMSAM